jgi:hypothetical protein
VAPLEDEGGMTGDGKAKRYAEHIQDLAHEHRVQVIIQGRGHAQRQKRYIKIPPIRGQVTYMLALHEIGHIAIRPEPPLRLAQEAAAWRWALANCLDDLTTATWRSILRCLDSYAARQSRWKGMKTSPEFDQLQAEVREAVG